MADEAASLPRWVVAMVALVALLAAFGYGKNPLTSYARDYAGKVSESSAITYLSLRTLNAFLSTAQEVEVGASFGARASGQPLKWLEPIDDTVELIAGVVFAVMLVTGVLSVALGPVSGTGWSLVALAAFLWCVFPGRLGRLPRRLAIYGGFLGLALPLAFVLASLLAERMTAQVWSKHQEIIEKATGAVGGSDQSISGDQGWLQNLRDGWNSVEKYQTVAAELSKNADAVIKSYIAILSVYIFRIFVLPALLVGAFWIAVRQLGP